MLTPAVNIDTISDDTRVIKLAEGPVAADRDFELTWKPHTGAAPSVGLFREQVGSGDSRADYLLAFVTPPGFWHAHFNEGNQPSYVLPIQDAGLQTYLRSLDIRFTGGTHSLKTVT